MSTDHLEASDDARLIAGAIDRLAAALAPPIRPENHDEAALRIQRVLIDRGVDPSPYATAIELADALAYVLVR